MLVTNNNQNEQQDMTKPASKTAKIVGFCLVAIFTFLLISALFGVVKPVSRFLYGAFGISAVAILVAGLLTGIFLICGKKITIKAGYIIDFIFLYFCAVLLVHAITSASMIKESADFSDYISKCFYYTEKDFSAITFGGVLCGVVVYPLYTFLTAWGTYLVLVIGLLVTLYFATQFFVKYNSGESVKSFFKTKKPTAKQRFKEEKVTLKEEPQTDESIDTSETAQPTVVSPEESKKQSAIDELYGSKINNVYHDSTQDKPQEINSSGNYTTVPADTLINELNKPLTPEEIEKQRRNERLIQDFYNLKANSFGGVNTSPIVNADEASAKIRDGSYKNDEEQKFVVDVTSPAQNKSERDSDDYLNTVSDGEEIIMEVEPVSDDGYSSHNYRDDKKSDDFLYEIDDKNSMPTAQHNATTQDTEQKEEEIDSSHDFLQTEKSTVESDDFEIIREVEPIDAVVEDDSREIEIEEEPVGEDLRTLQQKFGIKTKEELDEAKKEAEDELIIYSPYVAPSTNLLDSSPMVLSSSPEEIERNKNIIDTALQEFKIDAKVAHVVTGPTVTRYEIALGMGVSVKKMQPYADDLAMRLAAEKVRLELPIPGKDLAGIEVPNKKSSKVPAKLLIDSAEFKNADGELNFCVGIDINTEKIIVDLAKMPHMLVAGTTGSGKSVALNMMLASFIAKYSPEQVRLILVDPKLVEFTLYEGLPHLLINEVLSDIDKVIKAFKWAVDEMERRLKLMRNIGVRDIASYNKNVDPRKVQRLPRIVIVVDELADLMTVAKNELEPYINRLAAKSRAAGIHLVLATQRPTVQVINGNIKNNFPWRMALKVASQVDSKTILDMAGAEKLIGRGDMLFKTDIAPDPVRLQGAYIDTEEVKAMVDFVKAHNDSHFSQSAEKQIAKKQDTTASLGDLADAEEKLDELFYPALKFCIQNKSASISMIQRRFKMGYARAGKIICDMEIKGFVTPQDGAKPREVLITMEEFNTLFGEGE